MVLLFARRDGIGSPPPWLDVTVYSAQAAHGVIAGNPLASQQSRERFHILIVSRTEASIASAIERRTKRTASRARHRPQAWLTPCNHHTYVAAPFTLHAYAVRGQNRLRFGQQRARHAEQLVLIDRTAPHFEVDANVFRDGGGCRKRRDELRARIDDTPVLLDISPVTQRLNSARRRARTD